MIFAFLYEPYCTVVKKEKQDGKVSHFLCPNHSGPVFFLAIVGVLRRFACRLISILYVNHSDCVVQLLLHAATTFPYCILFVLRRQVAKNVPPGCVVFFDSFFLSGLAPLTLAPRIRQPARALWLRQGFACDQLKFLLLRREIRHQLRKSMQNLKHNSFWFCVRS